MQRNGLNPKVRGKIWLILRYSNRLSIIVMRIRKRLHGGKCINPTDPCFRNGYKPGLIKRMKFPRFRLAAMHLERCSVGGILMPASSGRPMTLTPVLARLWDGCKVSHSIPNCSPRQFNSVPSILRNNFSMKTSNTFYLFSDFFDFEL